MRGRQRAFPDRRTPAATLAELTRCSTRQDIDVIDLHVQKATLEDVFLGSRVTRRRISHERLPALSFGISLRLHFRNRMALLYGYLFPD